MTREAPKRSCVDCVFAEVKRFDDGTLHEMQCRRNAPQIISCDYEARWPRVREKDWCGEFKRAPVSGEDGQ